MSTMIERVARAIMEDSGGARDRPDFNWRYYESAARAAIEAVRDFEPTEAMMSALWSARASNTKESFSACWQAVIDAALKEEDRA